MKARIKKYIFSQNKNDDVFQLYDIDDVSLEMEINSIGETNLNEILQSIKTKKDINEVFIINKISAGFSGASVFKIDYKKNHTFILKISLKKDIIHEELNKIDNYNKFPPFLRINYEQDLKLENDTVSAIVSEMLENSNTLFDWVKLNEKEQIYKLLNQLFLEESLSDHYQKHKNKKEKYTFIFLKINRKFSYIEKAFKELEPIFNYFKEIPFDFKIIHQLIKADGYEVLNKKNLLGDEYFKELTLCHGDFHSQNILVKANRPTLIDTGGIGDDYWCMDVARLIVNLFIKGFDKEQYSFFSIEMQIKNIENANQIILGHKLELDGVNDSYINAINWINLNIENIYKNMYSKWEFQLGLSKEFLQISYKTDSLPPSKRVLAFYAAYNCIIFANDEIKKKFN